MQLLRLLSRPAIARRSWYSTLPPHTLLRMPALSPTMTTGSLGDWAKKPGDGIAPGDVLLEIETDKATMDFEAQEDGFVAKILVPSGTKDVPVNSPIAVLVEEASDVDKFVNFTPEAASATPAPAVEQVAPASGSTAPTAASAPIEPMVTSIASPSRTIASPLAKSMAKDKGLDLRGLVPGSGPNGRIVKADILAHKKATAPAVTPTIVTTKAPLPPVASSTSSYTDTPVSNIRRVIASRLQDSKASIPHFYLTIELEADKILKLREALNKEAQGKYKLSLNDFVVKAAALALKDVPTVNASWQGDFIRQHHNADIAVAVATENGLMTPILTKAETKGLATLSNSVKELAEKARTGRLTPQEYQGGSFTISNLGMYGIQHFTAIINPPHAAILAVGGLEDKLALDPSAEKGFSVKKTMRVTLSNDHRVVDGAVGAQWLQRFKNYFENPLQMLL